MRDCRRLRLGIACSGLERGPNSGFDGVDPSGFAVSVPCRWYCGSSRVQFILMVGIFLSVVQRSTLEVVRSFSKCLLARDMMTKVIWQPPGCYMFREAYINNCLKADGTAV